MTRYFLHVEMPDGVAVDQEGEELADPQAARLQAMRGIRDVLASQVKQGRLDLRGRIKVTDEAGAEIATVSFEEAVTVLGKIEGRLGSDG